MSLTLRLLIVDIESRVMINAIMLTVILLSVVMLDVVAPRFCHCLTLNLSVHSVPFLNCRKKRFRVTLGGVYAIDKERFSSKSQTQGINFGLRHAQSDQIGRSFAIWATF